MNADYERRLLTREQKMGAILLFAFATIAVGLGVLQLRNTIYGPFVFRKQKSEPAVFVDEKTRLQGMDTDHDGLNDYEELEFYETSPYIPDTDSDGVKDKEEIEQGTDPLCADGQTCSQAEVLPAEAKTDVLFRTGESESGLELLKQAALQGAEGLQNTFDVQSMIQDPAVLRALLLQSGKISEKDLQKIDDATILSIAKSIIQSSTTTPSS